MEAVGLAGFVMGAALLTIFLEHPALGVVNGPLKDHPLLRRLPLGVVMGLYVTIITELFGKKSGAFINPAITSGYLRLGRIRPTDAFFYMVAQFVGAIVAAQLVKYITHGLFAHPLIDFGVTKPKPQYGNGVAFTAELAISYFTMILMLYFGSSKRLEKYAAPMSGLLLGMYLIFETPFSGMSMNPARSFAGAFTANEWGQLWIYFTAPFLGMLSATETFRYYSNKKDIEQPTDIKEKEVYPVYM